MRQQIAFATTTACLAFLLTAVTVAAGQTQPSPSPAPAAPAPTPAPGGFSEAQRRSKQPASWLKWGADLRLRDEYMDNNLTLSSDAPRHLQNSYRVRPRLFATLTPARDLDLNVRLTLESRYWAQTSFSKPFHRGWDWNEVVFDHLNVCWRNVAGRPLSLQAGRMDLSYGDNWLVFEGTPLDGSRTINFDAARARFEWKARKTTIDVVYIDQAARNDRWLPPMRLSSDTVDGVEQPIEKAQIEQNERGAILYLTSKAVATAQLDGYFVYKGSRREPVRDGDDANLETNLGRGDDADVYTVGARVVGTPAPVWRYRAEGAWQTGTKNGASLRGFGFSGALMFLPKLRTSPELRLAYEFLSGDEPGTAERNEGFDILWGRWPRWSELYIYTYAPESRISQLGNLHRFGPGVTIKPTQRVDWLTDFNLLYADETPAAGPFVSGASRFRGKLLTSSIRARLNPSVSGHLWGELFFPGGFYSAGDPADLAKSPPRRDTAVFLRAELLLSW